MTHTVETFKVHNFVGGNITLDEFQELSDFAGKEFVSYEWSEHRDYIRWRSTNLDGRFPENGGIQIAGGVRGNELKAINLHHDYHEAMRELQYGAPYRPLTHTEETIKSHMWIMETGWKYQWDENRSRLHMFDKDGYYYNSTDTYQHNLHHDITDKDIAYVVDLVIYVDKANNKYS